MEELLRRRDADRDLRELKIESAFDSVATESSDVFVSLDRVGAYG